ncbi:MAG: D-amino acid aminotransferase [Alphaproteobacteria bacterium CG11_big_fil_rev_8_21_14_0_20_39_49]|nr:MAG: D-amino acid aminotransferase [Alphaproteobacteria bacterium CG11_big_fil_rev_8_21_14_0_20_39_49]
MSKISYVNGQYLDHDIAKVHIEDRGYVFSDGVYEVALVKKGVIIDWEQHCIRLQKSLQGLRIDFAVNKDELEAIVMQLLERNAMVDAVLYLQITRGVAPRLHQFPQPAVKPSITMTLSPYKPLAKEVIANGAKAITLPDLRWKLRNLKTISLLPNILAKQEALEHGAEEAILFEKDGKVTEGSSTNVFIIDSLGCLFTHPANENILGGITRKGVLTVAGNDGIIFVEESFNVQTLKEASEVFITSTTKHILPITEIDGEKVGDGTVGKTTQRLIELYSEYINKQL